jgi:hypothetical protein
MRAPSTATTRGPPAWFATTSISTPGTRPGFHPQQPLPRTIAHRTEHHPYISFSGDAKRLVVAALTANIMTASGRI